MGEFNSDDHYVYYHRQESFRRNGVTFTVNKIIWNAVFGCSLKNCKMILICCQGKTFNITVIQLYAPTTNIKEVEVDLFYEDLQDFLKQTPKKKKKERKIKKNHFHHRGLEWKNRKSRGNWRNRQFCLGIQNETGQKLTEFCEENTLVIANSIFQEHKGWR